MRVQEFHSGSWLHLAALASCLVVFGVMVFIARAWRDTPRAPMLRHAVGIGCIAIWVINTLAWAMPSRFEWGKSLPLHFCNMANLINAVAILGRVRLFQALTYFWAIALCIWGFLTPTLEFGPQHPLFWVFWIYHLFIGLAVIHVLAVDCFRPTFHDLRNVILFTFAYMMALVLINNLFGWNYGFVGPGAPNRPTPIDFLGDYPLRLVWMVLLTALVFSALWLPWHRRCRNPSSS